MKPIPFLTTASHGTTRVPRGLALAAAAVCLSLNASADLLHADPHSLFAFASQDYDFQQSGNDGHSAHFLGYTMDVDFAWLSHTGESDFGTDANFVGDSFPWTYEPPATNNGKSPGHDTWFFDFSPSIAPDCTIITGGTAPVPVSDAGSTLVLLGSGLATLLAFGRRFFSPA